MVCAGCGVYTGQGFSNAIGCFTILTFAFLTAIAIIGNNCFHMFCFVFLTENSCHRRYATSVHRDIINVVGVIGSRNQNMKKMDLAASFFCLCCTVYTYEGDKCVCIGE